MKPAKQLSLIIGILLLFQSLACGLFSKGVDVPLPTPSSTIWATSTVQPTSSLTTTPTMISTPTLSPSLASLRVVSSYDKQLWLWQNGTARSLTAVGEYTEAYISDDGERIAFSEDGLRVINSDGSNERLLVGPNDFKSMEPKDPGVNLHQFGWLPGTHKLLFNTRLMADYGLWYTNDLYVANADTLQWKALRKPEEGGKFSIAPDGQSVALITPNQISVMNIDGSHYRVLLNYNVPFPSEVAFYARPTWEPDSQSLTVPIPPEDFFYQTTSPTIVWRLPVDGMPPTVLAQLTVGDSGEDPRLWSPNKEHFVLWLEDDYYLDGAESKPLTEKSALENSFAWVDETHFLYRAYCGLWLGAPGEPGIEILASNVKDGCVSNYDFTK